MSVAQAPSRPRVLETSQLGSDYLSSVSFSFSVVSALLNCYRSQDNNHYFFLHSLYYNIITKGALQYVHCFLFKFYVSSTSSSRSPMGHISFPSAVCVFSQHCFFSIPFAPILSPFILHVTSFHLQLEKFCY